MVVPILFFYCDIELALVYRQPVVRRLCQLYCDTTGKVVIKIREKTGCTQPKKIGTTSCQAVVPTVSLHPNYFMQAIYRKL